MGRNGRKERGLRFYVHPLFFVLGIILAAFGQLYIFVVYTIVLVLHELGHSVVAERLGYALDELCLMPYGAVLKGSLEGVKPKDEMLIAFSGPLTNVGFSLLCMAVWWMFPASYALTEDFCIAGLVNAAFNLLPVYPLDGGTALSALLKLKLGIKKAARATRIVGIIVGCAMLILCAVLAFFSKNITYCIIGVFVFLSALFRGKSGEYHKIAGTINQTALRRGIEVKEYAVSDSTTLIEALKLVNNQHLIRIAVINPSGAVIATLEEKRLAALCAEASPTAMLKDVLI